MVVHATGDATTVPTARICFVHVPKTGGMAVQEALEGWAGTSASRRYAFGGDADWRRHRALSDRELQDLRLISGHIGYRGYGWDHRFDDWLKITVVREPVARVLSLYTFVRGWDDHPWHATAARRDLEGFVSFLETEGHTLDVQCRMTAATTSGAEAFDVLRERYFLAGTTEHLDDLMAVLGVRLGTTLELHRVNQSRERIDPASVDPATLRRIRDLNPQDAELYRRMAGPGLVGTGAPAPSPRSAAASR